MTQMPIKPNDFSYLQSHYTTVKAIFIKDLSIDDITLQSLDSILKEQQQTAFREYSYKADTALGLVKGDLAVVHANNGLSIVQISHVDDTPQLDPTVSFTYKWVIDKIDLTGIRERLLEEKQLKTLLNQLYHFEKQQDLQNRLTQAGLSLDKSLDTPTDATQRNDQL